MRHLTGSHLNIQEHGISGQDVANTYGQCKNFCPCCKTNSGQRSLRFICNRSHTAPTVLILQFRQLASQRHLRGCSHESIVPAHCFTFRQRRLFIVLPPCMRKSDMRIPWLKYTASSRVGWAIPVCWVKYIAGERGYVKVFYMGSRAQVATPYSQFGCKD